MARLVMELTNRCNHRCWHCFTSRHGGESDLSIEIIENIVENARALGFNHLAFTGGEPTLHPELSTVLKTVQNAGYTYSFVSNGWNFAQTYEKIAHDRKALTGLTFSLDGATAATHDRVRRNGSYIRVMQAASICVIKDIPFTFNALVTANNHQELEAIANLASKLGSSGLRFGHLLPTPRAAKMNLCLPAAERKRIDAAVLRLNEQYRIPILMAPGYYTTRLFPCSPLKMKEINIDKCGNATICCHLAGYGHNAAGLDVIGNLGDIDLSEAYRRFLEINREFRRDKHAYFQEGSGKGHYPCWYCVKYFKKATWSEEFVTDDLPTHSFEQAREQGGKHDTVDTAG